MQLFLYIGHMDHAIFLCFLNGGHLEQNEISVSKFYI